MIGLIQTDKNISTPVWKDQTLSTQDLPDLSWNITQDLPSDEIPETIEIGENQHGDSLYILSSAQVLDYLGLGKSSSLIPNADDWHICKKFMHRYIAEKRDAHEKVCRLPSGWTVSYDVFSRLPQFSDTLEKYGVHQRLASLLDQQDFLQEYDHFLENIQKDDWFKDYEARPRLLQYLGITAFLENKVSTEELSVIGMVGAVIANNTEKNRISVLNEGTIIPYLEEHYFVRPCEILQILHLTDTCTSSTLSQEWIKRFAARSPLERTSVLYLSEEEPLFLGEKPLHERLRSSSFSSDLTDVEDDTLSSLSSFSNNDAGKVAQNCLFSLPVTLSLFQEIFSLDNIPPSDHTLQFGYRRALHEITRGRPISMPGLFAQPKVHRYIYGLDIAQHDMAHIFLDWIHPYPKVFIDLAQRILKTMPRQKKFAHEVLDRVIFPHDPDQPLSKKIDWPVEFWLTLMRLLSETWNNESDDVDELIKSLQMLPSDLKGPDLFKRIEDAIQEFGPSDSSFAIEFFRKAQQGLLGIDLELQHLTDFVKETQQIHIAGHPHAFNPSIIRYKDGILLSFRELDAQQKSYLGLVWVDESMHPISPVQMLSTEVPSGFEDVRLITIQDKLYAVYSGTPSSSEKVQDGAKEQVGSSGYNVRIRVTELSYDKEFSVQNEECFRTFDGEDPNKPEKNWVPFAHEGELLFSYSLSPHKVLKPIWGTDRCETVSLDTNQIASKLGELRGGTPGILLEDGKMLGFFHTQKWMESRHSLGQSTAHYFMGAYLYTLDAPFTITHVSPEPIIGPGFYNGTFYEPHWHNVNVVFPGGFILQKIDGKQYAHVVYGRQDHEVWTAKIDIDDLLQSLTSAKTASFALSDNSILSRSYLEGKVP